MNTRASKQIILRERIEERIHFLRGQRVMISSDLAPLYAVPVKALIQAVRRNESRFPDDFLFQLTSEEFRFLKSQSVTSSWGGARRALPYAFTEQGVAMLSSVLRSARAVQVNIAIMRTFVHLRALLATHEDLRRKIEQMEKRYDAKFSAVFATLKQMLEVPVARKKEIGFHAKPGVQKYPH
jgi:ORF6N domain-containing protein